jgi:hypothetical protein
MAEAKTKPTAVSVDTFIAAIPDAGQREDSRRLRSMMEEITGEKAVLWGPSIVGFGQYHYEYDSGHSGDSCLVGFSPRKQNLSIYLMPGFDGRASLLEKLGKHKTAKACLYVKRLSDVDEAVLRKLIAASAESMRSRYPSSAGSGK